MAKLTSEEIQDGLAKALYAQVEMTNFYHDTSTGSRFWIHGDPQHPTLECKACGCMSCRPFGGHLTNEMENHTSDCDIKALFSSV